MFNTVLSTTIAFVVSVFLVVGTSNAFDDSIYQLIDQEQAVVVTVDDIEALSESLNTLAFWKHQYVEELEAFFGSKKFEEFAKTNGIPLASNDTGSKNQVQWKDLVSGRLTAVMTPRKGKIGWFLAFETSLRLDEILDFACNKLTLDRKVVKSKHCKVIKYGDTQILKVNNPALAVFFHKDRCFVCSDIAECETLIDRIAGKEKIRRPFSTNRKLLNAANQVNRQENNPALAKIFVDPKAVQKAFPGTKNDFWKIAGIAEVYGIYGELRSIKQAKAGENPGQLAVDVWVGFTAPQSDLFKAISEAPSITDLPDIEIENPSEIFAVNFDLNRLNRELGARYNRVSGTEDYSKFLRVVEKDLGLISGKFATLEKTLAGTILYVRLPSLKKRPFAIYEIKSDKKQSAIELVDQISKHSVKGRPRYVAKRIRAKGVDFWIWTDEQIDKYHDEVTRGVVDLDVEMAKMQPPAFSVSDKYVAWGNTARIKELSRIRKVKIGETKYLGDYIQGLNAQTKAAKPPSLVWLTSPDRWRSHVAGFRFRANQRRLGRPKKVTPEFLKELLTSDLDLEEVRDFDTLYEQMLIRLGFAACDTFGHMMVACNAGNSGIRITVMTYANAKAEKN